MYVHVRVHMYAHALMMCDYSDSNNKRNNAVQLNLYDADYVPSTLLSTLYFKLLNPQDNPQRVGVNTCPFYR